MNTRKISRKLITLGVITLFLFSLQNTQAQAKNIDLKLSITNLADAGDDHYEGWLIVDGKPVSTGKFAVDSNGKLTDLEGNAITSFSIPDIDLEMATDFVISLELKGDTDTTPSAIKPFAGKLSDDKMSATISHNIGKDFSNVAGKYILATPTNGADNDENSGIWYLDPSSGTPVAGLDLPDLTGTDWIYEGWVIVNGIALTTGTFSTVNGVDDADPYSSTEAGPPFPGEDYIVNAPSGVTFPLDLAGDATAITIEPRKDNSPAPFQFHPLMGDIPSDAVDHKVYDMSEGVSLFASGSITITESTEDEAPGLTYGLVFLGLIAFTFRRKYR